MTNSALPHIDAAILALASNDLAAALDHITAAHDAFSSDPKWYKAKFAGRTRREYRDVALEALARASSAEDANLCGLEGDGGEDVYMPRFEPWYYLDIAYSAIQQMLLMQPPAPRLATRTQYPARR